MTGKLALKPNPTLADLQQYIKDMVAERHWQAKPLTEKFMLLIEEAGELSKSARKVSGMSYAADSEQHQEAGHEAADLLMVLLDICNMLDIDLEQAFRDKEEKNKARIWK